jgi:small subunit ribosomal protein S11
MAKAPAKGAKKKTFKKKEKRVVHVGIVHIQATFNNTIVTIADPEGNTVSWSSAGSLGFAAPARARRSQRSKPR